MSGSDTRKWIWQRMTKVFVWITSGKKCSPRKITVEISLKCCQNGQMCLSIVPFKYRCWKVFKWQSRMSQGRMAQSRDWEQPKQQWKIMVMYIMYQLPWTWSRLLKSLITYILSISDRKQQRKAQRREERQKQKLKRENSEKRKLKKEL